MGEYFGLFFFIATSLLGIVTLIGRLLTGWLKGNDTLNEQVTVTLRGHAEEAEFLLRRYVWLGFCDICVIDAGMDEQTAAIVARFMQRHHTVRVERR